VLGRVRLCHGLVFHFFDTTSHQRIDTKMPP
jgi:hypothetical protein